MTCTLLKDLGSLHYSILGDRLTAIGKKGHISLIRRLKPRPMKRLVSLVIPSIDSIRVEHYEILSRGTQIAVKYGIPNSTSLQCEIKNILSLRRNNLSESDGLLLPRIVKLESPFGTSGALVSSWQKQGTLQDHIGRVLRDGSISSLNDAVESAAQALQCLHATSARVDSEDSSVDGLLILPEDDKRANRSLSRIAHEIDRTDISNNLWKNRFWIHGDCFAYQFLLANREPHVLLTDWESARPGVHGMGDLAQLWASIDLSLHMEGVTGRTRDRVWQAFCRGYGENLRQNLLFKLSECKALIRFSPRSWKFPIVTVYEEVSERGYQSPKGVIYTQMEIEESFDELFAKRIRELKSLTK